MYKVRPMDSCRSGSPLEGSSHNVVPWWDNEDSNNSTFGLALPKVVSELQTEDNTLSNILNGLKSLGKSFSPWSSGDACLNSLTVC